MCSLSSALGLTWEFPKIGVPYLGFLIIRILLFRVLDEGPLFFGNSHISIKGHINTGRSLGSTESAATGSAVIS